MLEPNRLTSPAVSVLMPVYNAVAFVGEAIQSILDQTFGDFEFIIINDGSTDGSDAVIRSFTDPRIRYCTQQNQGIAGALNLGLDLAKAPLIARQDADDVSLPERLAKQVAFMAAHPDVGLLGTWASVTSADGVFESVLEHPVDHVSIQYAMLFDSPFVHPSVIFRKELIDTAGGYKADPNVFEDYDLWSRMIRHTRTANIPERLVRYRLVDTGISRTTSTWIERRVEQRRRNMLHIFPALSPQLLGVFTGIGNQHPHAGAADLRRVHALLNTYIAQSTNDPLVRERLRKDMRAKLMSYRMVQHNSLFHRAMDKVLKTLLLAWSTFRLKST